MEFYSIMKVRREARHSRKITRFVAKYSQNRTLYLGNLSAKRDWGYAPEYNSNVKILQYKKPEFCHSHKQIL